MTFFQFFVHCKKHQGPPKIVDFEVKFIDLRVERHDDLVKSPEMAITFNFHMRKTIVMIKELMREHLVQGMDCMTAIN